MLRIGSRNSPLALAQAHSVARLLAEAWPELAAPDAITVVPFITQGDRSTDSLSEIGGKGLFTAEIEDALLKGTIDLAVHSLKDMPTLLPDGLVLAAVPKREDPRDLLILGPNWQSLAAHHSAEQIIAALPRHAKIGSAALRRKAQLLHHRPDLEVVLFRGNVGTRLRKLQEGLADATLLALAGVKRLGLIEQLSPMSVVLESEIMLPAVAQGALALEIKRDHPQLSTWLAAINHPPSQIAVTAERAMLAVLDGSCRTPIGGLAQFIAQNILQMQGLMASPDGAQIWRSADEIRFDADKILANDTVYLCEQAEKLGQKLGAAILRQSRGNMF